MSDDKIFYAKDNNVGNIVDTLEEDWTLLEERFNTLETKVATLRCPDVLQRIRQQQRVLKKQKPTKQVYRAAMREWEKLQQEIQEVMQNLNKGNAL